MIPVDDERGLYYYDWVQGNLEKVTKATGGRVGYMHIPDMGVPGLNEFAKYFYPQTDKDAMIVDVRSNGGGNVSPMIIERLRRELVLIDIARNGAPQTNPGAMILGPKVLLADEFSASDGDLVTYRFKTYKMGPVIGKRTWGGVVGIRGTLPLLDGGVLNRPEFSRYDVAGKSVGDRGRRRRAGHLRRQRSGAGVRRRGPAARQGDRGHPRPAEEEPGQAAAAAAAADQAVNAGWNTPATQGPAAADAARRPLEFGRPRRVRRCLVSRHRDACARVHRGGTRAAASARWCVSTVARADTRPPAKVRISHFL